jgi:DNA-binding NtrC family response regulator
MNGEDPELLKVNEVLLVDDDDHFRNAHERLLNLFRVRRTGAVFHARGVASGQEALDFLAKERVDCTLIDYQMPDGDGLVWLQRILELYPDMPIILVTGAGDEGVAVEAMRQGAMDYLIKGDFNIEILEKSLENAITRGAMAKKIEEQKQLLLESERYRVMSQTLAAACHHLGQPVTVLHASLVMVKRTEDVSEKGHELINDAFMAIEKIYDIIWRLQHVSRYETEGYLKCGKSTMSADSEILKI